MAAEARAEAEAAARSPGRRLGAIASPVAVPFRNADQWNAIRQRILSTDGVIGVDVSTIARNGAMIRLHVRNSVAELQNSLIGFALRLGQSGTWVLQP